MSPIDAFTGTIQPTRVSPLYRAGLALVALGMILLPLIYIALIIGVGKLVWWHLANDAGIFSHVHGRATFIALLLYLGPAVAGAIFVLFLIKPLFSRAAKSGEPFKISEATEPQLFAIVKKVCDLVGAPHPREIRLDNNVNAAAAFRRGWLSFLGNDLVLIIGMPLVAGMTMRQFVGVLAHEFGHFAQGGGMRFSYIIRSINMWFARVVYQRDTWDDRLEAWSSSGDWWLQLVFRLAKGGVWAGRKVLWCLMTVGHAMSSFMSRQMEYDADSYEAKVAGSSEFPRTAERLRLLSAAHSAAMNDAYQTFQHRELPDDIAALTLWRETTMPPEVKKQLDESIQQQKTSWSDTHPADKDRNAHTATLNAPGVFHVDAPAAALFVDFPSLSQAVTRHHFATELEVDLSRIQFRTLESVTKDRQGADLASSHLEQFFGTRFHPARVHPLPESSPRSWQSARDRMKKAAEDYDHLLLEYKTLMSKFFSQSVGHDLISAKFSLSKPADFELRSSSLSESQELMDATNAALKKQAEAMLTFESAAHIRIASALNYLDQTTALGEDAQHRQRLITAQRVLADSYPSMLNAMRASNALNLIFENAANHNDGVALEQTIKGIAQRIEVAVTHVIARLGTAMHPFAAGHPPIADALHQPQDTDNPYARAFKLANICSDALIPLLARITGELCGLALQAESTMDNDPHLSSYAPPPGAIPPPPLPPAN